MNLRPSGYEPDELPGCSTPRPCCVCAAGSPRVCGCGGGAIVSERFAFLSRSGGDLLSHVLRRSTIGATALNGRVRDGIGCFARAMATRPGKKRSALRLSPRVVQVMLRRKTVSLSGGLSSSGSNQANRAISTGQLSTLLRLHLRPIDVVVFHGSRGIPCFEGGFTLRCLQRLSCPFIATLHCGWRHNRSTSGTFTPVLSY